MKIEQGSAPAILLKDGKKVFEFTRRFLDTEDQAVIDAAFKAGAVEYGKSVPASVLEDDEVGITVPAGYDGLKKPEIVAKAAEEGFTVNPNQSKADMLAAVINARTAKGA